MTSGPDQSTFREILGKILDQSEQAVREMKDSERRIMSVLETQRVESREDIRCLDKRVRDLETDLVRADERVKGVAGKVAGLVSFLVSAALLAAQFFMQR